MLRHVTDAGLRVLNDTDLASRAEVVVVAGTTELVYDDLRNAVQAVLRGADLWPPPATPPTLSPTGSGPAPARSWQRSSTPPAARPRSWASRTPSCSDRARPPRRGPHAGRRRPRGLRPRRRGRGGPRRGARPQRRQRPRRWTASSPSRWRSARRSRGCWRRRGLRPRARRHLLGAPPTARRRQASPSAPPPPPAPAPPPDRRRAPRAGAPRTPRPRNPCAGRRAAQPPRRLRLVAQQRQQLLERLRARPRCGHRHVVPVEPRRVVGGEVVAGAHHRDDQPHRPRPRRYSISAASRSGRWSPPSPRPFECTQLARPRPPDSAPALPSASMEGKRAAESNRAPARSSISPRHVPRVRLRSGGAGLDPA